MKHIYGKKVHIYRPDTYFHRALNGKGVIIKKGIFSSLVHVKDSYWGTYTVNNKWIYLDGVEED